MPPGGEALDPALILEDWMNRVANLPEEIRFLQDEIADKDRQYSECIKIIDERDGRIQKFIKANGSHEPNPREETYRKTIADNFAKAETLADEKIALAQKMQAIMDRHVRQLDMQIKQLYDRGEPGFTDPDEVPSLLRPSAANQTTTSARLSARSSASLGPQSSPSAAGVAAAALTSKLSGAAPSPKGTPKETAKAAATNGVGSVAGSGGGGSGRGSNLAQVRQMQAQQGHAASAPASPAATMILSRNTREGSAGLGSGTGKRGPRANSALANAPPMPSGLARHSSLGPGTPKAHQTATGAQRAGSAGPRATTKAAGASFGRKAGTPLASSGTPNGTTGAEKGPGPGRKKGSGAASGPALKKSLARVKRPAKHSAASSTAESELSDAESASDSNASSRRGTPARGSSQGRTGPTSAGGGGGETGTGSNGGSSGGGGGDKEGSAQPLVKREKDSVSGVSVGGGSGASAGSGGGSGLGGGGGPSDGAAGGGGGGVTTKRRAGGDGPGGATRGVGKTVNAGTGKGAPLSSDDRMDLDEDEAGDDRKYCLCQNVSFGDMVACDNEDCPFEWFHWSCVGLKSEPNGTWYCPVCTEKMGGTSRGGSGNNSSNNNNNIGNGGNSGSGNGNSNNNDDGRSSTPSGNAGTGGDSSSSGGAGGGTPGPATTKKGK